MLVASDITRSTGLLDIRAMLDASGSGVKVIGVVEEGVKGLLDQLMDLPMLNYSIGLMADSLTIASGAYQQTMKDVMAERGLKASIPMVGQALTASDTLHGPSLSNAFAAMIENHYNEGKPFPICAVISEIYFDEEQIADFHEVIDNYRSKRINGNYPYRTVISDKVIFVNAPDCAAKECYRVLRADNNLALRIGDMRVIHYTDLPM